MAAEKRVSRAMERTFLISYIFVLVDYKSTQKAGNMSLFFTQIGLIVQF
jgi:hypothetical protein